MGEVAAIAHLVVYPVSENEIQEARDRFAGLEATTKEGYEEVRLAIASLRTTRGAIEKRRVELKADALDYGRRVDAVAKKLTTLVSDIEEPLKAKRDAVDAERERVKREAERAELVALEARLRAERETEEARLKAERDAENERLRAEGIRLAQERAAQELQQRRIDEEQRTAQAKIDADRRALDEQRQALEAQQREAARAEAERQRLKRIEDEANALAAEIEAATKAAEERTRLAAIKALEDAAVEAARLEAMRPDIEKVRAWGKAMFDFGPSAPEVESAEAQQALAWAVGRLQFVAHALETYKPKGAA